MISHPVTTRTYQFMVYRALGGKLNPAEYFTEKNFQRIPYESIVAAESKVRNEYRFEVISGGSRTKADVEAFFVFKEAANLDKFVADFPQIQG